MNVNADLSHRASAHVATVPWVTSPAPGVERRMLDRIGGEVARATSIVRYAAGSRFPPHVHERGEEFLVLDGVFEDENGAYRQGSYVRNPPTSRHAPGSSGGCTIFVKLRQFDLDDRTSLVVDTIAQPWAARELQPGVMIKPLFSDAREDVRVEHWPPHAMIDEGLPGGAEYLVLSGIFTQADEGFSAQSWLRLPAGGRMTAVAGAEGCTVWVKRGHLAQAGLL